MSYLDPSFLLILSVLVIVTRILPFNVRKIIIVFVGLFLLATWSYASLVIFLVIAVIGYAFSIIIIRVSSQKYYFILPIAIGINILLLAFFKYRIFLVGEQNAENIFRTIGSVPIPLAISFYVFHIISYQVDLARGGPRARSALDYAFYLAFFPHLIAGPIVRGWQLLSQTKGRPLFAQDLIFGTHYLVVGFALKAICADGIGAAIDRYWGVDGLSLIATDRWIIAFSYYCQIYSDFAGYSLMALGMARLLGFRLPANFRLPMLAKSFQEFWRRWHITLSRWLRDYLFIPLGGSKHGAVRTSFNLMIVMTLGGLWHGAGWTFIIWGMIHGIGLTFERIFGFNKLRYPAVILWGVVVQLAVIVAWVFFRSSSLSFALEFISGMFSNFGVPTLLPITAFTIPVIIHHFTPLFMRVITSSRLLGVMGFSTGAILVLVLLVEAPPGVFIYFKF